MVGEINDTHEQPPWKLYKKLFNEKKKKRM